MRSFVSPVFSSSFAFDYPAAKVGQSQHVSIFAANSLGSAGVVLGRTMQPFIDVYYNLTALLFKATYKPPCNIILSPLSANHDGSGGAYHYSCAGTDIYVDVRIGANSQFEWKVSMAFFVAELTEVFETYDRPWWMCNASNGEALSRVFAELQLPGQLNGYESVPYWMNNGRPDFVSKLDMTDVNPLSIGCSVAFIYFLYYQLGINWFRIVDTNAPTLEDLYRLLTGKTGGYAAMMAVLDKKYPPGTKYPDGGISADNPFPIK